MKKLILKSLDSLDNSHVMQIEMLETIIDSTLMSQILDIKKDDPQYR